MTEKLDLYHCEVCGNLVQVLVSGEGELVCCGKPMHKLDAKTQEDAMTEKHVPVFIERDGGVEIRVGEVLHPMIPEHYIMFIETISEDKNNVHLKFLHSGEEPKMFLKEALGNTKALEFCNIHGLWEGQNA